jgi:hypothetical protein
VVSCFQFREQITLMWTHKTVLNFNGVYLTSFSVYYVLWSAANYRASDSLRQIYSLLFFSQMAARAYFATRDCQ